MKPSPHLLLAFWIALKPLTAAATPAAPGCPNIVIFVADDMGHADAGFMGGTECRTPALDALAASGAVLTAHYVQPVCSPTRAALLTGRLATRTGVYSIVRPGARWGLPLSEQTLADVLRGAGYETALCGKWHLGEFERDYQPTRRGFDHQYGHFFGAIDYFTHVRDRKSDWYRDDQPVRDEGYSTTLLAREACRIIRERDREKPLFLYVPFNAVHAPHQVPASYEAPFTQLKGVRKTYAGMLAALDEAVGQILAALDESTPREKTLVLFTSDNGGPAPGTVTDNGPLRAGKGTIYEGGVRACAFVTWPGHIPAGQRIAEPLQATDWLPTLAKIAGGKTRDASELDGRDILPVLTSGAKSPHESILIVGSSPAQRAVRAGSWKLLAGTGAPGGDDAGDGSGKKRRPLRREAGGQPELYNLEADPGETTNLAGKHPGKVRELGALAEQLVRGAANPGGR